MSSTVTDTNAMIPDIDPSQRRSPHRLTYIRTRKRPHNVSYLFPLPCLSSSPSALLVSCARSDFYPNILGSYFLSCSIEEVLRTSHTGLPMTSPTADNIVNLNSENLVSTPRICTTCTYLGNARHEPSSDLVPRHICDDHLSRRTK